MTSAGRPRVVATDVDGTLLRSDGSVSTYTREVLHEVREAGISVILVTARPPRWMHDLADIGVEGVALCGNGAFTYDLQERQIVDHTLIPADDLAGLVAELRDAIPGIRLATEGRLTAVDGTDIEVHADSLCTHGDSPGAVEMARAVHAALLAADVTIAPFAQP